MKKLLTVLTVLCLVLGLAACSGTQEEEKPKIGVVVPDLNNAFCTAMDEGVKRAAKEKGYEVFEYVTQVNPENDINSVELLHNNNVKAYYGLHMVADAVGNLLKNSYPEIGCFSQVQFDGAAAVVDDDFTVVAAQFIESLDAFLAENNMTTAEICGLWLGNAQIEGSTENLQYKAVMKAIEEHYAGTGVKYVQSEYPADSEAVTNTVETLMLAHPDATVFFCHNNDYAIASANIIKSAKTDTSKYYIFATEGDDETLRQIADPASPYRAASVADTEQTGYLIGLQCVNWIENGKMEGVSVARQLVDWRNVNK
ncbi:MAG: substrate-binding domain-containing protein [Erysipelotrichaceae bacterium]|nr:substrate-binding domain-containing protein [Erysipelotrichaceae bacterium]